MSIGGFFWRRRLVAAWVGVCLYGLICAGGNAAELFPAGARRILFLGDSITYSGQYVAYIEAYARLHGEAAGREFLNLGLPSETVSGLSEPGHAGGKFPRPDLHERLDRVLAKVKPDLVFACYGMNDGIYYPYSVEMFQAFQEGIEKLRSKVKAAGADLIHVTPPVFDPLPIRARTLPAGREEYRQPYVGYNEVLDLYGAWLVAQRGGAGWRVVDAHGPMNCFIAEQRRSQPQFRLAGDGVHMDDTGHWLAAREILVYLGAPPEVGGWPNAARMVEGRPRGSELLRLVQKKQRLLSDAWLTETRHLRPGMAKGLPLDEAQKQAAGVDKQITELLAKTGE